MFRSTGFGMMMVAVAASLFVGGCDDEGGATDADTADTMDAAVQPDVTVSRDDGGGAVDARVSREDGGGAVDARGGADAGGGDASSAFTSLLNGRIAVWSLDGSGTDSSGNALDLAVVSGTTFASAKFGQGLSNAGDQPHSASRPMDDPKLRLATGDFTISAWALVRAQAIQQDESAFIVHKGGVEGAWVGYNGPGFVGGYGMDLYVRAGVVPLAADTFHHLVLVREGQTIRYYVDGMLGEMISVNDIAAPSTASLRIGSGGRAPFDGVVDDVGIWNRALTADERAYLGKNPIPQ